MAPNIPIFQETAVEAFPMAIVGFAVAFSVAKVYSVKHDYTIDGNQVCDNTDIYDIKIKASGDVGNKSCPIFCLPLGANRFRSQ